MPPAKILVTGGSGFVGAHCIVQLLAAGHEVRTTVRSLAREAAVRDMVRAGGIEAAEQLTFVAADLEADAGWAQAMIDVSRVLHVASPLPATGAEREDELVRPARDGTLRVLRAARDAGVTRVVVTSSFAAIGYGHERETPFDERDWTDLGAPDVQPYVKSKALAERAAWDFLAREGGALEMAVINPVAVMGPVMGPDFAASVGIVKMMLDGAMPVAPRVAFGVVDVRDVAALHVTAMTHPAAAGERFLAVAGPSLSLLEIAALLRARLGRAARRAPRLPLPDAVLRLAAPFSAKARQIVPQLGKRRNASGDKARRLLGFEPRPREEAILAAAESLIQRGLVKG